MFELFINGVLRVFLDCDRFNGYTLWVYSLRQAINFIIGCFFICDIFIVFGTGYEAVFKHFFENDKNFELVDLIKILN